MTTAGSAPGEPSGLGRELRDARLGRGLSLEDCQSATRISRRYLEALEQEDFAALPAPVFARGFLRSYAQSLGLDSTSLLARFPGQPRPVDALPGPEVLGQPPRRPPYGGPPREAAPDAEERFYDEGALAPLPTVDTQTPNVRLGPWLVAAFVVVVVLAGVVIIVTLGDDAAAPGAAPDLTVPGVVAGPAALEGQAEEIIEPIAVPENLLMPDLTTQTVASATDFLRAAGVPFVIVEIFDAASEVGAILDQLPPPNTPLDAGSAVTVVVSRGPAAEAASPAAEDAAATPEAAAGGAG